MKLKNKIITTCLTAAGLLAVAIFVGVEQKAFAQAPPDPAHAAHLAPASGQPAGQAGGQSVEEQLADQRVRIEQLEAIIQQQSAESAPRAAPMDAENPGRSRSMPSMGSGAIRPAQGMAGMNMTGGNRGGSALADQFAELRTKMQRLETTLQEQAGASSDAYRADSSVGDPSSAGAMPMGGKSGMGPGKKPMQGGMAGMGGNSQPGAKPGMGGGAMPASSGMAMMMSKMDNMMGMMDKMMGGMGGGAPAAGAPMAGGASGGMGGGMGMKKMKDGMDAMPASDQDGMSKSDMGMMKGMAMKKKMGMEKMKMMGMMGGMKGMNMPSALPGFPGASHLYHIGATGYFLDHPEHITLSAQQQFALNRAKQQAELNQASLDRKIEEGEQELWVLTSSDQPDAGTIEAKIREIEKLRGDQRLAFIRSVGEAAKVLSEEQRMTLVGTAAPGNAAAITAASPHQHNP